MPHPQRKSPRLRGYDYRLAGAYFVTVCTHNRACVFGQVLDGEMRVNALGEIATACWTEIPTHFPLADLDVFVVMPNHVHGIIVIDTTPSVTEPPAVSAHSGATAGSLGAVVGSFKSAVTRAWRQTVDANNAVLWQQRYHDRIIRNERELNAIRQYILANPACWAEDEFNDWRS